MAKNIVTFELAGAEGLLEGLDEIGKQVRRALSRAAQAGARVIQEAANEDAPGRFIVTRVRKATQEMAEVGIGPDREHWYYTFFEYGATAHEIAGRGMLSLAWEAAGQWIFRRRVHHPGMPARPFLRPAFDENQERAVEATREALDQAIQEALSRAD